MSRPSFQLCELGPGSFKFGCDPRAFGFYVAGAKLRAKFLDMLFECHDDVLLIVVTTGGAPGALAVRVKDHEVAA